MVNNKLSKELNKTIEHIFFEYLKHGGKNKKIFIIEFEDIHKYEELEKLGFINIEKIKDPLFKKVAIKANIEINEKLKDNVFNKKMTSKKWNNPHDKILYKCIDILNERNNVYCFSDFEIGLVRPDILLINKDDDFLNLKPIAFEIKHSRNDFFNDIKKPEKRKGYLSYAEKLYYVCEENLIKKEEVPDECGLIYLINNELRIIKDIDNKNIKIIHNNNKLDLLLTLIVRTSSIKKKAQIGINERIKKFNNVILTKKENARRLPNSFSFNDNHSLLLVKIMNGFCSRSSIFNSINYPFLLDNYIWGLIDINDGEINITSKGEMVLKTLKEYNAINDENILQLDISKNNIFKNIAFDNLKQKYISIPLTKKSKNLIIRNYFFIEKDDDIKKAKIWLDEQKNNNFANEIYLVTNEFMLEKVKLVNQSGVAGIMLKSKHYAYIKVRIKKNNKKDVSLIKKGELLLTILKYNVENNRMDHIIFY